MDPPGGGAEAERVDLRGPSLRARIHPADGARLDYRFLRRPGPGHDVRSQTWTDRDILLARVSPTASLVGDISNGGRYEVARVDAGRDAATVELVGRGDNGIAGIRKRFVVPALFNAVMVCYDLRSLHGSQPPADRALGVFSPPDEHEVPDPAWAAVAADQGCLSIEAAGGDRRLVARRPHVHVVIGSGPADPERIRGLLTWGGWSVHRDGASPDWATEDTAATTR